MEEEAKVIEEQIAGLKELRFDQQNRLAERLSKAIDNTILTTYGDFFGGLDRQIANLEIQLENV